MARAVLEVVFVPQPNEPDLSVQPPLQRPRPHRHAVLVPLTATKYNLIPVEVDVTDSQLAAFESPQARSVEQFDDQRVLDILGHGGKPSADFISAPKRPIRASSEWCIPGVHPVMRVVRRRGGPMSSRISISATVAAIVCGLCATMRAQNPILAVRDAIATIESLGGRPHVGEGGDGSHDDDGEARCGGARESLQ